MVTTRRRSALHGDEATLRNGSLLPPRGEKTRMVTVKLEGQGGLIPSLPSGPLASKNKQRARRESAGNIRPQRQVASSKELMHRSDSTSETLPLTKPKGVVIESAVPRHFLGGINLSTQDIMSLPSPPTPKSGERRKQRRLSMSFLETPLQDMTNKRESPVVKTTLEKTASSKASGSKKRRSLCHVPSPVDNTQERSYEPKSIVLDDEEDLSERRSKRSKRRQSLLLPSDHTDGIGIPPVALPTETEDTVGESKDLPAARCAEKVSFADLQKLVRGYYSIMGSSQHRLKCAENIKDKTGYDLGNHNLEGQTREFSDADNMAELRKRLLSKQPIIMQMDKERKAQAAHETIFMRCSVAKGKGGKYTYKDLSGQKISRDEYKKRYKEMISKQKIEKKQIFQNIMRQDLDPVSQTSFSSKDTFCTRTVCSDGNERSSAVAAFRPSTSQTRESSPKSKPTLNSDSPPLSMQDQKQNSRMESDVAVVHDVVQVVAANDVTSERAEKYFPSREEESEDPEIAAAERKLWIKIDAALEEYSAEVLSIQARRPAVNGDK